MWQGLHGEFEAQVALSIREQLRDYSRVRLSAVGFAHSVPLFRAHKLCHACSSFAKDCASE